MLQLGLRKTGKIGCSFQHRFHCKKDSGEAWLVIVKGSPSAMVKVVSPGHGGDPVLSLSLSCRVSSACLFSISVALFLQL